MSNNGFNWTGQGHPRGPNATAKYLSYSRRRTRSLKLNPSTVGVQWYLNKDSGSWCSAGQIALIRIHPSVPSVDIACVASPYSYSVGSWQVEVSGCPINNMTCTCPDFTQVDGGRNWVGSNAGPFDPCKHIMAVKRVLQATSIGGYNCNPPIVLEEVPAIVWDYGAGVHEVRNPSNYSWYIDYGKYGLAYRYEGREWEYFKSNNPPISYTLTQTDPQAGQCFTPYYVFVGFFQANTRNNACGTYTIKKHDLQIDGRILGTFERDGFGYISYEKSSDKTIAEVMIRIGGNGLWVRTACTRQSSSRDVVLAGSLRIDYVERIDGLADDCGVSECKFKILEGTSVVYSRTEETCPEVLDIGAKDWLVINDGGTEHNYPIEYLQSVEVDQAALVVRDSTGILYRWKIP